MSGLRDSPLSGRLLCVRLGDDALNFSSKNSNRRIARHGRVIAQSRPRTRHPRCIPVNLWRNVSYRQFSIMWCLGFDKLTARAESPGIANLVPRIYYWNGWTDNCAQGDISRGNRCRDDHAPRIVLSPNQLNDVRQLSDYLQRVRLSQLEISKYVVIK